MYLLFDKPIRILRYYHKKKYTDRPNEWRPVSFYLILHFLPTNEKNNNAKNQYDTISLQASAMPDNIIKTK